MKLWGGRFEKETNAMVDAFNACIGFGSRLYEQDILGSIAHATMLGEENIIRKVGGNPEVKKHLEDLGFVAGGPVTVISALGGNLIVNVKDSRIAISREMAGKIMV